MTGLALAFVLGGVSLWLLMFVFNGWPRSPSKVAVIPPDSAAVVLEGNGHITYRNTHQGRTSNARTLVAFALFELLRSDDPTLRILIRNKIYEDQ